jgi:guanyl-specific ribonuclease Sa
MMLLAGICAFAEIMSTREEVNMASSKSSRGRERPWRAQGWTRVALILIVLAVGGYLAWRERQNERREAQRGEAPATTAERRSGDATDDLEIKLPERREADQPGEPITATPTETRRAATEGTSAPRTTIPNQTIRDEDGDVAFRGEIDVGPTIERIRTGRLLGFPNDGTTFQNRERRLPRKPVGYYKEYVHPTPGLRGPGPQRIVAGEEGEFYYTPDHYRTFRRVD